MVQRSWHRVTTVGRPGSVQRLLYLPKSWCDGIGLEGGTRVEIVAGRALVVLPPDSRELVERVLRLMREGSL
jgi:hypothetical protein